MVYNEMSHVMPSNGFGSPFSPPDALLEGREVPSPSQYSDPSTPPSLHSPPHYYSDAEKTEHPMKEEPHSPYTFGTATLLSVPTSVYQQQQEPLQHDYQQYQHQYMYQQQNKVVPSGQQLEQRKPFEDNRKLEQHFTQEMLMKIEQALNDPGFDTLDCLLQAASAAEASENCQQNNTQSFFGQGSQQQQSFRQEHGHQTPEMIPNENLINPEIFTAISVSQMTPPRDEATQEAQNTHAGNCNAYSDAGDASSFQTGYKSNDNVVSNDIKMEVEDLQNLDMDNLEDSIMAGIMSAAGISQNLAEWSNVDVRSFMRACVEYLAIPEPIRDTDGRTLLSLSKEQFINWMGVVEASPWHELLFVWITKHKKVDMKDGGNSSVSLSISEPLIQVKQEALHTPEMKMVKQEMALNMMLPVTVTNHNQTQCHMTQFKIGQNNVHTAELQASQKQSVQLNQKHERQYQEYLLAHQLQENQHNRFQPQTIKLEQVQLQQQQQQQQQLQSSLTVQSFQLKQSQHQYSPEPQQQQQSFLTQRSSLHQSNILTVAGQTPCHIQHPSSISTPQHGAPASLGHNPSSPSDSAHIPLLQTGLPSGAQAKGSCSVSQQDGVDYIDESGTDLSSLLQPTPSHQHPTTIDQDDTMETDEEGEDDPPVSSTGTTGRTHIQLWQFLKELLNNNKKYGSCIRWLDRQEAIFKIEDSVKVANLWGERKNRPQMNYDKLSRSIRQYYNKNIMKKTERSQRLVYQFCAPYGQ